MGVEISIFPCVGENSSIGSTYMESSISAVWVINCPSIVPPPLQANMDVHSEKMPVEDFLFGCDEY